MFHCKPMKEDGNLIELTFEYVEILKFHIKCTIRMYTTVVHNTKDNLMSLQFEKEVENKFVLKVEQWM